MQWNEIKSLLNGTDDPVTKLEILMDIGRDMPPVPEGAQAFCKKIEGCSSQVEICRGQDGKVYGAAQSGIVRGITHVLIAIHNAGVPYSEFDALNLNLGAQRMIGKDSIIEYLKSFPMLLPF